MKKIFLFVIVASFLACNSSKKVSEAKKITATKNQSGDLVGYADQTSFMQEPYNTWFNKGYDGYTVDAEVSKKIKKNLKGITVKGFMGTWCGDSKRETPRFFKIADEVGLANNNIDLVTVNRSKKTPENLQEGYNIFKVPTFIFFKNGKEIGRFVEYPRETLEKDILKIVSGEDYKHSYQK